MAALQISPVVRAILTENLDLPAAEVIRRAKARGVKAPDSNIRTLVHNIRSDLKKAAARTAPAAARETQPRPAAAAAPAPAAPELSAVLANVALVNQVVRAAGGVDPARQVAEAVRACGGVDAFLQHLDLVAGIRTA